VGKGEEGLWERKVLGTISQSDYLEVITLNV